MKEALCKKYAVRMVAYWMRAWYSERKRGNENETVFCPYDCNCFDFVPVFSRLSRQYAAANPATDTTPIPAENTAANPAPEHHYAAAVPGE